MEVVEIVMNYWFWMEVDVSLWMDLCVLLMRVEGMDGGFVLK